MIRFTLLALLFISCNRNEPITGFHSSNMGAQYELEQTLMNHHNSEAYREHLYQLTKNPHIAGTSGSRRVIEYMSDVMVAAGLRVDHYDYDAWMPEPGEVRIELVSPVQLVLNNKETAFEEDPYSSHPDLVHGWNAYSGSGEVTAEVVYANYGRKEDFEKLKEMGVDVSGKIVIARYGGNFRGFKAKFAEAAGAAGLIIYTDPANGGFVSGPVYPEGRFSDPSAIQRGSLLTIDYYGDPLTPFEPALPLDGDVHVERLDPSEVDFHTIPVAPIGYGAAEEILSRMDGADVPEDWQGGLPFTYKLTGGSDLRVNLFVDQPHDFTRITNVVGVIEGNEYPDEWIIMGSHHDAWGFGATDPNSGTAMLLVLAESLGEAMKQGYQPKRSIMIAHWDAEEFLLIGSSEWTEQLRDELNAKAILYLNADMSVTGPNFRASSSPSLKKPIIEASKRVEHPDTGESLFEYWQRNSGQENPTLGNLGGGSDHVGFYMHLGIPSAGVNISGSVPIYHTNHDSFYFYETFIDSTFSYGPALAGVYAIVATRFAGADILPYDLQSYGRDLITHTEAITRRAEELNREFDNSTLMAASNRTVELTSQVERKLNTFVDSQPSAENLRAVNQLLISLERSFLQEEGLPFSKWQQSLYTSPDPWSGYASWMIPGVRYVLESDGDDNALTHETDRFALAIARLNTALEEILSLL